MVYASEVCGSLLDSLIVSLDNWYGYFQSSHIIEVEIKEQYVVHAVVCSLDPTFRLSLLWMLIAESF